MHPALALIALSGTDGMGACPCAQNVGAQLSATTEQKSPPRTSLWLGGALLAGVVGYLIWSAE